MSETLIAPRLEWFPRPHPDARYLTRWRAAKLSYSPGDEQTQPGWHHDHYENVIAPGAGEALFARAADLLMRYQFYPAEVIEHVSDFELAGRWAQTGDRVIQRIHAARFGLVWVDVVTMTAITAALQEPRRAGFTYTTTEAHFERGEWQVELTWRENGEIVLNMRAVSKPGPRMPWFQHPYARWLQLQAHRRGIAAFTRAVNGAGQGQGV